MEKNKQPINLTDTIITDADEPKLEALEAAAEARNGEGGDLRSSERIKQFSWPRVIQETLGRVSTGRFITDEDTPMVGVKVNPADTGLGIRYVRLDEQDPGTTLTDATAEAFGLPSPEAHLAAIRAKERQAIERRKIDESAGRLPKGMLKVQTVLEQTPDPSMRNAELVRDLMDRQDSREPDFPVDTLDMVRFGALSPDAQVKFEEAVTGRSGMTDVGPERHARMKEAIELTRRLESSQIPPAETTHALDDIASGLLTEKSDEARRTAMFVLAYGVGMAFRRDAPRDFSMQRAGMLSGQVRDYMHQHDA